MHPEQETLHIQNSYTVQGPLDSDLCCAAFAITVRKDPVPKQLIVSNQGLEMSMMSDEPIDRGVGVYLVDESGDEVGIVVGTYWKTGRPRFYASALLGVRERIGSK
jgi:hypothetical protein